MTKSVKKGKDGGHFDIFYCFIYVKYTYVY